MFYQIDLRGDYLCQLTYSHIDDVDSSVHCEHLFHVGHFDLSNLGSTNEVKSLVTALQHQFVVGFVYLQRACNFHRF